MFLIYFSEKNSFEFSNRMPIFSRGCSFVLFLIIKLQHFESQETNATVSIPLNSTEFLNTESPIQSITSNINYTNTSLVMTETSTRAVNLDKSTSNNPDNSTTHLTIFLNSTTGKRSV